MDIENEFQQIYNSHAHKVYGLCLGYASGDENLAQEWQQETFIKVWNHRKTFRSESSLGTWIYRIAVNTCLGDLRKPKKLVPINEAVLETGATDGKSDKREAQIKRMYQCIDKLSPTNKAIILLELEEVPQAAIAEMQGIAHGALRTRLSRIRNSLLKCITNEKR
ncbi:sigma-70 family RNA polymerase sigma factor [Muricauda sp. NFXS6]|uniref:RNA polymerase sigma factor n=1 Tax=Allomuricauda sp. NFXS6 TaxID=2819094 RepID=UPI0032DF65FD